MPHIHPLLGQRSHNSGLSPVYSAISKSAASMISVFSACPERSRNLAGNLTATEDSIRLPEIAKCSPSRCLASTSTDIAGSNSVSTITGDTFGSVMRMSGLFPLPLRTSVFSDLTTPLKRHKLRVSIRTPARASFMVCSVVAILSVPAQI